MDSEEEDRVEEEEDEEDSDDHKIKDHPPMLFHMEHICIDHKTTSYSNAQI